MSNAQHTRAQIFLIKAAEDEAALHAEGNPETVLGFHAQQSVEKLIKALLSQLGVPLELTHNLTRLQTVLIAAGETLPTTPLLLDELTDYAVVYRYDLLTEQIGPERVDLITTVRILREHVVARIAALSATP
jgi:HEPN domain-containing protein